MSRSLPIINFAEVAEAKSGINSEILPGVRVRHWSMDRNSIGYQKQDGHTLSLYLNGGETCFRSDQVNRKGAPGKICLMPQGHDSQWHINDKVEFVHLYFSENFLQHYAVTSFDIDSRFVELSDLLYQDDEILKKLIRESFLSSRLNADISPLFAEEAFHKVMHHLLKYYNGHHLKTLNVTGGLSPLHRRQIKDAIYQNINDKISIENLARLVNMSPFHFAHMFKESFGESPANYVTKIRIDKVKALLNTSSSIADISTETGFSNQSHMTRHFKKLTGTTPAVFQQACMNSSVLNEALFQ